ncbi:POTRA domain-containing protein, partial [Burkholderia sp. SIMBA_019]
AEAKAILAAYEGKTMGAAEIMAVVRDLTNHYIERGYVTTVVTVHPGTLKSGTLTLEVKWGTIKDMTRNGKPVDGIRDTLRLFGAMPFAEGARLNLQDID